MLGRQILQPIDPEQFQAILKLIWQHLPKEIKLSSGATIPKSQIRRSNNQKQPGLICTIGDHIHFIFKQIPTGVGNAQEVVTELSRAEYDTLIASLPYSDHKVFLQCLNIHTDFQTLLKQEYQDMEQCPFAPLQEKPLVADAKEFDIPLLKQNQGTVYLQNHLHAESWVFMLKRMELFKKENIKVLYLELPCTLMKPLFKNFNETGDTKMLESHLKFYPMDCQKRIPFLVALCKAAHFFGIELYPIDTTAALLMPHEANTPKQLENNEYRDGYMCMQIAKHQKEKGAKKFIAFLGALHANVAHHLKVPAVILIPDENVQSLDPQNTTSKQLLQTMRSLRKCAQLELELYSTERPKTNNRCCTSERMRFGFFATAAAVAVAAVSYASLSLI